MTAVFEPRGWEVCEENENTWEIALGEETTDVIALVGLRPDGCYHASAVVDGERVEAGLFASIAAAKKAAEKLARRGLFRLVSVTEFPMEELEEAV